MTEFELTREMAADVEAVWAIFDDYGNLSWVPGADNVEVIGEGIGMIRRLHMPGLDQPIDEILRSKNAAEKCFSYTIPKNAVIPFDDYCASVSVSGDSCAVTVVWRCSFDCGDMAEEDAVAIIRGSYGMMLDALSAKLEV